MALLRVVALILISWWAMMAVHEAGHVLSAWLNHAAIERVVLWPWTISETVRSGSVDPAMDAWAGPVLGAIAPALLYLALRMRRPFVAALAFFAGFCLVANGVYLGFGWLDSIGDTGDLQREGTPVWEMAAFGATCIALGLLLWHEALLRIRSSATLKVAASDCCAQDRAEQ